LVAISTTALVAAALARQPAVEVGDAAIAAQRVRQHGMTVVAVAVSAISLQRGALHAGIAARLQVCPLGYSLRLCLDRLSPQQTGGQNPGQHTLNNIHGFSSLSES
jgi:hypothetical protein